MQLVFTPALGSSTTVAVVPGTVVQFAARVSTRDYNEAVANGTTVELWGDLPRPNAAAGDWAATRFEPAPAAPEHHDAGVPPNVLSLLPADPEPVPTTSAAPETTLLVASFVIPADVTAADYQFTYRLAHSNESSTWHTWLGDAGSNGHLVINQDAAPVEGLVFSAEWSTTDDARESPADGTVANLSGPVDWSGWALDLDPASESPAPPRRFSTLPKALSATHLALFPNPGLTSLNPASHAPVLLSSSSRLSLDDRALTAHGSPIRVAPLSRAAVQSSLPEHAVLLPESACTSPFVVVHDTRGAALSILPTTSSPPGTQILSLDLDQAKISADSPAKSLLFSPSANKATFYTPGARVAVPSLGADLLVQETYPLGENGLWEVGVAGATKVNEPAPEPEAKPEPVEPAVSPTKVAPPPIQTSRPTTQEFDMPPSPETPAEARIEVTPAKPPRLDTVTEVEPEPEHAVTPRSPTASASFTSTEKKGVLALLKGVAAVVMYYVTRSAWSIFGWGFRMFGVGVHAANQTRPKSPEGAAEEAAALVEGPTPVVKPIARAPAPASTSAPTDESESDSETGSLNEVAPTPIDPTHSAHVGVVSPNSPARRPDVNMPLTPPMSPKTTTTAPFVIPGPVSPPKPKVTFASPAKSTVFVVGPSTDELEVKVGGVRIPTAWDRVSGPGEGCTWVMDVEVGEGRVEVGVA